jgi:hypothetical protein
MISERTILTADDGSGYSDKVTIVYEDKDGLDVTLLCDPDAMYAILHMAIVKMSSTEIPKECPPGANPEIFAVQKAVAKLMRVGVKGLLMMYGDMLLTVAFGSKQHPKPAKGDDLLDWYTDMFTKIGLSHLMKKDTVLQGKTIRHDDETRIVAVDTVFTRPVAAPETHENTSGTDA